MERFVYKMTGFVMLMNRITVWFILYLEKDKFYDFFFHFRGKFSTELYDLDKAWEM